MSANDIYRFPFLVNSVCAASLGFSMNMLLLYLITKRTPSIMRPYARIMKIHCLSDVAYDSVCFITGLHPTPIGGHVFCLWQGFITKVPLAVNHLLFSCWYWVCFFDNKDYLCHANLGVANGRYTASGGLLLPVQKCCPVSLKIKHEYRKTSNRSPPRRRA
jgi:hypothetical protein